MEEYHFVRCMSFYESVMNEIGNLYIRISINEIQDTEKKLSLFHIAAS
jgi:hypothetical protein